MAKALPGLHERVREAIQAHRLLARGDRVLIGVSGGPDSVALLHLLAGLKDDVRIRLAVVHVDHQLRPDSQDDAEFVAGLARRFGLPATIVRRDVRHESEARGLSLEDRARRVRYAAFQEIATAQAATRLALAHTADDQAETVLMRLLRGAGITGLAGIPMTRSLGDVTPPPAASAGGGFAPKAQALRAAAGGGVTVIRPLLGVWRGEVLGYLRQHRLPFRQDATNRDPRFLRNRIRHELLPLLEREYNPQLKLLLNQLAEQCRTDAGFLSEAAQRYWKRVVKPQNGHLAIHQPRFLSQPKALQRQLIRLAIQQVQGDLTGFEFRHWVEIERLFTQRPVGTRLDLPGSVSLKRLSDQVLIRRCA
ncbi:MAG: tRNA lysidine(34) synthetase TilS [Candidatus Omnitrophica bacterium]|nr:tRNA lysidine(34) synthetase TilS [Candidatus Omnitrophota bacterium]